jgi:hypothetical protein
MKTLFLAGVAVLSMLSASANARDVRNTCELQIEILKSNRLHVRVNCKNREGNFTINAFNENLIFHHPRGGPHDTDHECILEEVERIDQVGYLVYDHCKYREGGKRSALTIQLTETNTILITNAENY